MKFRCPKCSAKYKLDENKVRKSTFKMQCRKCSTWLSITIPKNKKDTEKQLVQEKPSPSQKASKKLNIPRPPKPKRKSKKTENPKGLDFENPSSESLSPKHAPGQALPPETDSSSELAIGSGLRIPVSAFNENLGDSSGTQTFIVAAGLDNNYQKKRNLMVLLTSILVLVSAGFLTSSVINSPKKEFKFKEWKKKPVITKKWGKVEISDEDKKLFAKLKDGFEDPQKKLDQEAKEKNSNTILFENAGFGL